MMWKKKVVTVVASFICITSYSQAIIDLKTELLRKIPEAVTDFTTDNLGNIYLINSTGQIKKIDEKGDSIAVYNDVRRYGRIYSIDATNPLKVLVFYKDFSSIVVLDRLLNVRATIDLRKTGIFQTSAITSSYDNNIWLFDELNSKLKKIDDSGNLLMESSDFRQVFDAFPTATALFDRDGQLYLYDAAKGLYVFDYYGAKKNNYPLLYLDDLQVSDKNTITARDSTYVFLYKPATLQMEKYNVFPDQIMFRKINFNGNKLYALTRQNELEVFKVVK